MEKLAHFGLFKARKRDLLFSFFPLYNCPKIVLYGRFTDNFFSSYVQLSMSQVRLFSGKPKDTLVLGLRGNPGFSMVF